MLKVALEREKITVFLVYGYYADYGHLSLVQADHRFYDQSDQPSPYQNVQSDPSLNHCYSCIYVSEELIIHSINGQYYYKHE